MQVIRVVDAVRSYLTKSYLEDSYTLRIGVTGIYQACSTGVLTIDSFRQTLQISAHSVVTLNKITL